VDAWGCEWGGGSEEREHRIRSEADGGMRVVTGADVGRGIGILRAFKGGSERGGCDGFCPQMWTT